MAVDGLCTLGISVESSETAPLQPWRASGWLRGVGKWINLHITTSQENSPDVFCRRGGQEPVGLDVVGDAEWNC